MSQYINREEIMHVTELTESHINELKEYIEINELGHIITRKNNVIKSDLMKNGISGGSRAKVGKRRGGKTKYGMSFGFKFPSSKEKLTCKAREIVWVLSNGVYPPEMKVTPKNGDLFDDRPENLCLKKRNNGRPPQAGDNTSRKPRVKYTKGQIRKITEDIIELTTSGLSLPQACKKLGISKSAGSKWVKMNDNYKPAWNCSEVSDKKKYDLENLDSDSGIYAIVFHPTGFDKNNQISKCYIGSSVDTKTRIQTHLRDLKNNKHYNSAFQKCFNANMQIHAYLLESCDEEDLLAKEEQWRAKYCEGSILNKNKAPTMEEMKPWLEAAKETRFNETKYVVNEETGCWEWKVLDGKPNGGYGNSITVSVNNKVKYIIPHRLSYYIHKGEYPELVRHMCNNKCCVNPDHLESGSHRQNNLDNSKELRKEFESLWLEYERDIKKLTKHFGWNTVGTALNWERKLGLREKYPDIYWENSRFLSPKEKQEQSAKKRKSAQERERQMERLEAIRDDVINIKKRYSGASQEVIAAYFNIKKSDVAKITKGATSSFEDLWNSKEMVDVLEYFDSIDASIRCASKAQLEGAINRFPHLEKQIKNFVPDVFYECDHKRFTTFFSEFIENKKKQKASI